MDNYRTSNLAFISYLRYFKKLQPLSRKKENNKTIFEFDVNTEIGEQYEIEWASTDVYLYMRIYENTKSLLLV